MSYCRFSSDNWRCDVYVYENVYGEWETHVAGRRRMFPPIPDLIGGRVSMALYAWSGITWDQNRRRLVYPHTVAHAVYRAWTLFALVWHHMHMWMVGWIPRRPIGLPHDGECFIDNTPGECASRLESLRDMGYRVPQFAIDALKQEANHDR